MHRSRSGAAPRVLSRFAPRPPNLYLPRPRPSRLLSLGLQRLEGGPQLAHGESADGSPRNAPGHPRLRRHARGRDDDFSKNVLGTVTSPATAMGASAQTAEEVADCIAELIANPMPEIYTNPAHQGLARTYYQDVAAFEAKMNSSR